MIEMTLEEATVESLADAAVIMAVGFGDRHMSNVLLGRREFARVAGNPALVAETKIVRVKIDGEEQFEELKGRVEEAKGGLDPDVKAAVVKSPDLKSPDVKEPEAQEADVEAPAGKAPRAKKSAAKKAKADKDE